MGNYGKIPVQSWVQKVMLPLILATPTLYTPFPPHRGSTGIFRRIKSDTSSGQRNLPVLLRFRRVVSTAETRWIHRHKRSRGGPLNFNPSHPIPLPTGTGGFMKKHPGCTVPYFAVYKTHLFSPKSSPKKPLCLIHR